MRREGVTEMLMAVVKETVMPLEMERPLAMAMGTGLGQAPVVMGKPMAVETGSGGPRTPSAQ